MSQGPPVLLSSPDPRELSSGEAEELQRIKWHRKQLLEDIQVCSHSRSQIHMLLSTHMFVLTHPQTTHTHKQAAIHVRTPPDPAWAKSGARFQPTCSLSPGPQEWGKQNSQGSPHSWVQLPGLRESQESRGEKGNNQFSTYYVQSPTCMASVWSHLQPGPQIHPPRKCRPFGQDNTIICPALVSSPVSQASAHLILSHLLKQALLLLLECATLLGPAPGPLHSRSPLPETLLIPPHGSFFS